MTFFQFPLYLCIKRKNVGSQFVSAYQAIYGKYENKGRITFGSKMFKRKKFGVKSFMKSYFNFDTIVI